MAWRKSSGSSDLSSAVRSATDQMHEMDRRGCRHTKASLVSHSTQPTLHGTRSKGPKAPSHSFTTQHSGTHQQELELGIAELLPPEVGLQGLGLGLRLCLGRNGRRRRALAVATPVGGATGDRLRRPGRAA
jgi:hypothetical protein